MYCPFCNALETKVIDSRLVDNGSQVKRRRECCHCSQRFTTFETAELVMPSIIKSDGRREIFSETNLRQGTLRALEKRPVSMNALEEAIADIKRTIRACGEREVDSQYVGGLVMKKLQQLDDVAYVRFASVYKRFTDVSDFSQTIDQLKKEHKDSR